MIVKATANKGRFRKGVEYDLEENEARGLITAGLASFVCVAPAHNREKPILPKYETR